MIDKLIKKILIAAVVAVLFLLTIAALVSRANRL